MSALDFNTGCRGRYLLCKDPRQVGKPQAGLHLCFRPDAVGWQFGGPWPYQKRVTANEQRYWCLSGRVIHPRGRGDVWGAWSVLSHNRLLHVCDCNDRCGDFSDVSWHVWVHSFRSPVVRHRWEPSPFGSQEDGLLFLSKLSPMTFGKCLIQWYRKAMVVTFPGAQNFMLG